MLIMMRMELIDDGQWPFYIQFETYNIPQIDIVYNGLTTGSKIRISVITPFCCSG